jgi:hypothetical protein
MKKVTTAKDTENISLTIYNGGFGAVKETRKVNVTQQDNELVFADVAQQIEVDSLLVEGLQILEFNYDYDLVGRNKLLNKYIDMEVYLKDRKTGDKKSCRLLSVENDGKCVLEDTSTMEIYIDTEGEIILPSLPSGLIVKPALIWKIEPKRAKKVNVSYLSRGFQWDANYVIELMDNTLSIVGWAEIENQSGATYENANIKLIAGDVKRVEEDESDYEMARGMKMYAAAPQAEEKSFFDYHMYTLLHPTTLKNNQTKQINILSGSNVPYKKYYNLDTDEEKVNVIVEFENSKKSGLGIAMPKGKIKFYMADTDGSLEFIGEDVIDHTPKDEIIKQTIGNAFDITFEYDQVDRKKINGFEHYRYECIIRNHKEEAAEVHLEHHIWGVWDMVYSSHDYIKNAASWLEFVVNVPADSEEKISFEYKIDRREEIFLKK